MIVIPLEDDQQTISRRFRKADYFFFIDKHHKCVEKNGHKTSKSDAFFDFFKELGVTKLYVKALGYKTFKKLEDLGIEVFLIQEQQALDKIEEEYLVRVESSNAKELCTLGHK